MSPARIQRLRRALRETAEQFGARFVRSGRTVEDWEQGRRIPGARVVRMMETLEKGCKTLRA